MNLGNMVFFYATYSQQASCFMSPFSETQANGKNASSYVVCGCGSGNDSTGGSRVGNYILGLQFIGHSDMTSPRHKEHCMCNLTMYPATGCQKYSVNSTNTSMPR